MEEAIATYIRLWENNGGHARLGQELPRLLRTAGFTRIADEPRVARSLGMNHAPFLGFAGIPGVLHPRARVGCGLCSVVAHGLAHWPAVLRHRAFAMDWRR